MEWLSTLLPITVVVAVALFIVKEILEWVRRSRADRRKVEAFKTLLGRECELNNWAHRRLGEAVSKIKESYEGEEEYTYAIKRRESGEIVLEARDEDENLAASWPLPIVHTDIMGKLMLDVAMLDQALFGSLETAYDATINLNHLRQSLINFIEDHDDVHLEGFVDYAQRELPDVHVEMEELYQACTGQELTPANSRIR